MRPASRRTTSARSSTPMRTATTPTATRCCAPTPRSSPRGRRARRWPRCRRRCWRSSRPGRGGRALGREAPTSPSIFGPFDFAGSRGRAPTQTFTGELDAAGRRQARRVASRSARRTPSATCWCTCPDDRTVFTGDILFIDGTPLMWAGPVRNWLARLRPDPRDGRGVHRARPRPDDRPRRRAPGPGLPALRGPRGPQAFRRRHDGRECGARHRARRVPQLAGSPSASRSTWIRSSGNTGARPRPRTRCSCSD